MKVPSSQTKPPSSERVRETLLPWVDYRAMAGAVALVADAARVLSLDAVGYADLAARRPMCCGDLFWIASMTKPMTATCAMMLIEEGKLDVAAPVSTYLPEFAEPVLKDGRPPRRPITVADLLTHSSGLPFMSATELASGKIDTQPLAAAMTEYARTPLESEPGSRVAYSNMGINIVGRMIEVLSAVPFERFMAKRLLEPLGMSSTTFFPNKSQLARLACAYRVSADGNDLVQVQIEQLSYPLNGKRYASPAGGLFSTAEDVAAFGRMILRGGELDGQRYLSADSVRTMTSTQNGAFTHKDPAEPERGFGFGWETTRVNRSEKQHRVNGSCGHAGAYQTKLWIDAEHGLVEVFMVQQAGTFGGTCGVQVLSRFGETAVGVFGKRAGGAGAA